MAAEGASGGGVGFAGLLTVLFIGLKLTHNIDWPWLWVLSPLWIGLAPALVLLVVALVCFGVVGILDNRKGKR